MTTVRTDRLFIWLMGSVLCGCANYATLQDASTMPEGKAQVGLAGTMTTYGIDYESTVTTSTADGETVTTTASGSEQFTIPALVVFVRAGVTDRLELHGSAWLPLGASFGFKYMLVGDREEGFILSPGVDVGAPLSVSVLDEDLLFMDVIVPVHLGYRLTPGFATYVTPKYGLRIVGDSLHHVGGSTVGIAIGERLRLLVEGTLLYDATAEDLTLNGAIGLAF